MRELIDLVANQGASVVATAVLLLLFMRASRSAEANASTMLQNILRGNQATDEVRSEVALLKRASAERDITCRSHLAGMDHLTREVGAVKDRVTAVEGVVKTLAEIKADRRPRKPLSGV